MSWSKKWNSLSVPTALWLLLVGITACTSDPVASAATSQLNVTPTQVNAKPAVVYTIAAPATLPSFALMSPEDVAATEGAQEASNPSVTPLPLSTATSTPVPTTTPTSTPMPTFTPPALPLTSADEHYWLRRPIPEGGAVWTDKSYPYGHTRGGTLRPHHGVEFYVPSGTEILAAASGTVLIAGDDSAVSYGPHPDFYGRLVVIELDSKLDGQPIFNLYGHLSEVLVTEGQHVEAQEIIAHSGASGVADGPHLHFEVRMGENNYDSTRNPLLWLYPFPNKGVVAGRVLWTDGALVHQAPISLRRVDALSRYAATTTYAAAGVNSDHVWKENFVMDDVEAGYYEVIVDTGEGKFTETVWVFPYRTSFVEITLDQTLMRKDE